RGTLAAASCANRQARMSAMVQASQPAPIPVRGHAGRGVRSHSEWVSTAVAMERMDIGAMVQGRAAISRMKQTAAALRAPGATTAPGAPGRDRARAPLIRSPLAAG